MRKFSIRWWRLITKVPNPLHSHEGVLYFASPCPLCTHGDVLTVPLPASLSFLDDEYFMPVSRREFWSDSVREVYGRPNPRSNARQTAQELMPEAK